MQNIVDATQGKKTYFFAILTAIYALSGYFTGHLDFQQGITYLLAAGTVFGFRSALNK